MDDAFRSRLRQVRKGKKLSQAELAIRSGLEPSAISHFESGRRFPSTDNLRRLADSLCVSMDYLVGRQNQPNSAGPLVDRLFKYFEQLTADDQDRLTSFAQLLAKQQQQRCLDRKARKEA